MWCDVEPLFAGCFEIDVALRRKKGQAGFDVQGLPSDEYFAIAKKRLEEYEQELKSGITSDDMYDKHREAQLSSEWIRDTVSAAILQVSGLDELCGCQVLVRTEDATCTLTSDKETIAKQVNASGAGGFERLDKEIMKYRIEMLKSIHAAPLAVMSGYNSMIL